MGIKQDDHVYIGWKSKLEVLVKEQYNITGLCDFAFGKEEFFFERVAMAFPRDSPWIPYFDKEIKKVVQGGLVQRWKQVFWPADDECSAGPGVVWARQLWSQLRTCRAPS